ncbi:hypothetical protein G6F42_028337 [Rhizopus arrhizus]|nr:hypothetical protein G6F42_028337 [Rhizopus arrhizus]
MALCCVALVDVPNFSNKSACCVIMSSVMKPGSCVMGTCIGCPVLSSFRVLWTFDSPSIASGSLTAFASSASNSSTVIGMLGTITSSPSSSSSSCCDWLRPLLVDVASTASTKISLSSDTWPSSSKSDGAIEMESYNSFVSNANQEAGTFSAYLDSLTVVTISASLYESLE